MGPRTGAGVAAAGRRPPGPDRPEEAGFALALVVLLLFAIAVAGATGYEVVRSEAFQAQQSTEAGQALAVAQAGLQWFMGNHRGVLPDSAVYSINGGTAVVRPRRIASLSTYVDLYLVTSEGTYTDPRFPEVPARRVVHQYGRYVRMPLEILAPLVTTADRVRVRRSGEVDASDHASPGQCVGAPRPTIAGVVARNELEVRSGGSVVGNPPGLLLGSFQTIVDTMDLAWDVYTDPDFSVDFDGTWPNFAALPSDSFPVIRVKGNFTPNWRRSGRGVLIIDGNLNIPAFSFWSWQGIVVAGRIQNTGRWDFFWIWGMLVGGLGRQMQNLDLDRGSVSHHSCYVQSAALSLARIEPLDNTWWEG